jgi:putative transposase
MMGSFNGADVAKEISLTCVRWYLAYPLSYRQIEEMMQERALRSTIPPSIAGF